VAARWCPSPRISRRQKKEATLSSFTQLKQMKGEDLCPLIAASAAYHVILHPPASVNWFRRCRANPPHNRRIFSTGQSDDICGASSAIRSEGSPEVFAQNANFGPLECRRKDESRSFHLSLR
jgi:hypothetical protein